MKQRVESYVWHDAKKHKPPTCGQYLVFDDTVWEGFMWVAEWDSKGHPNDGDWDYHLDYEEYKITHWADIAPPTINKQFQWTNIHDPVYIKAPSLLKSNSRKKSSSTSTP